MKNIVIVTNSISGGGAENSMLYLHEEFLIRGFKSTLLALNSDHYVSYGNLNIIELGRSWKAGSVETFKGLRNYRRVLRDVSPDVIILNCELPELYGAFTNLKQCKLFVVEHTSRPWYQRQTLGILVRLILEMRRATWVTVNSQNRRIWPTKHKAIYMPNPIALPILDRAPKALSSLVFVGRLRPEKRAIWAIQLAAQLGLSLDIYGAGLEEEDLKRKSERLGVAVKFHGYEPDVWKKIEAGQLVVVPSKFEGDGIVVLEALAMDCPVILADNQDLRRFQLPDLHYCIDVNDMAYRINNIPIEKFKVSTEIRTQLLKNRTIEYVVQEWIKITN